MSEQWKNDPVWRMTFREHEESAIDHEKVDLARKVRVLEQENARLKELNHELTETLKRVNDVIIEYQSGIVAEYIIEIIEPVLTKIRGETNE